jgi:hypothetical protein
MNGEGLYPQTVIPLARQDDLLLHIVSTNCGSPAAAYCMARQDHRLLHACREVITLKPQPLRLAGG